MIIEDEEEDQKEVEIEKEADTEQNEKEEIETLPQKSKLIDNLESSGKVKVPVHVLTDEDVASGKYTIADIIMPLPGFTVEYPPNMKEYYEELLTKDNLNLDLKHKIK